MLSDCHMHTGFSLDSDANPEDMIESALAKGLDAVCFTDHEDKDYISEGNQWTFDVKEYFDRMRVLQEQYRTRIPVRIGVEIGLQPHLGAYYREYVGQNPFDFVIGSVHLIGSRDPYYKEFFEGRSDADAYEETFLETYENIRKVEDFDVLGHLDYVTSIDTKFASAGQGVIVVKMAELLEQYPQWGMEEAVAAANALIRRARMAFIPNDMEYLRAGGRVSNATALCGRLLSIHPLIEILDGYLTATKKLRGPCRGGRRVLPWVSCG